MLQQELDKVTIRIEVSCTCDAACIIAVLSVRYQGDERYYSREQQTQGTGKYIQHICTCTSVHAHVHVHVHVHNDNLCIMLILIDKGCGHK